MLQLTYPAQAAFLFHDCAAAKGFGAVLNVATFLERVRALESADERTATRAADHEALTVIERTTTREVHSMLASNVAAMRSIPTAELTPASGAADAELRLDALRRIYAWITTGGAMARTAITRPDRPRRSRERRAQGRDNSARHLEPESGRSSLTGPSRFRRRDEAFRPILVSASANRFVWGSSVGDQTGLSDAFDV